MHLVSRKVWTDLTFTKKEESQSLLITYPLTSERVVVKQGDPGVYHRKENNNNKAPSTIGKI